MGVILLVDSQTALFKKPIPSDSIRHRLPQIRTAFFCEGELFLPPEKTAEGAILWLELAACKKESEKIFGSAAGQSAAGQLASGQPVSGRVRIFAQDFYEDLMMGDRVRLKTSLKLVRDFKNPGSFSAIRYYEAQGIDAFGSVSDPSWIVRLPGSSKNAGRWFEKIRKKVTRTMVQNTKPDAAAFLSSLLAGERKSLSPSWEEAFRAAGVSHLLSISGLHVAMVALIFLFFFRIVFQFPPFYKSVFLLRAAPVFVIPVVWLYVAVAGFPVSAVRAAVMATLFLAGQSLWRRTDLLSALFLAAFFILALSPLSLFQASFQLSFVAVLFLILFVKLPLSQGEGARERGLRTLLNSLAISCSTLLGLAPLLLYHFHMVSLMGIFANIVIVPMVNIFIMPLGMIGWLLSGLGGFGPLTLAPLWHLTGFFAQLTLNTIGWFASHAEKGIFYGALSLPQLFFYYAAIAVCFLPQKLFRKKRRVALAVGLMAIFCAGFMKPYDGKLRVHFLDVGQGDSAVIQLPNGKVWVVDGGGVKGSPWDIGRFVVAPYLWEEGIYKVDKLFLSHPHHDHYKGLQFLVEHFSPKVLFTNGDDAPEAEGEEWQKFLAAVKKKKIEVIKVTSQTRPIEEAGVVLQFFAPGPNGTLPHFDTNDNSVVMKLVYKNRAFLFPGDLMREGENLLLASHPDLRADVLKLGHHGSDTSTQPPFLNAVNPKHAVISVGLFNEYGLPDEPVLARLQEKEVQLFRTDQDGAITFTTDGQTLSAATVVRTSIW